MARYSIVEDEEASPTIQAKKNRYEIVDDKSELNEKNQIDEIKKSTGYYVPPVSILRDIAGGAVGGAQRLGSAIGEAVEYPTHAAYEAITGDKVPHYNVRELFGLEGDKPVDLERMISSKDPSKLAQLAGEYGAAPLAAGKNLLKQMIANGLWSATQADPGQKNAFGLLPEGRTGAAIEGAVLPAALGAVAKGIKAIPKVIDKFSPGKKAKELMEDLSGGHKNTREATESITNDIREAHNMNEAEALEHLNFPLKRAGTEKIYEHVDPLITTKMDKSKSMINRVKDLNVGPLFETFKKEPTFQNAHNLKSELGHLIGELQRIPGKTPAQSQELGNLVSVRKSLEGDVKDFLKRRDLSSNENLLTPYEKGTELYRDNVAPYLSNLKLRQIVREGRTTVPNVHQIFESPYDLVEKLSGKKNPGPITKILADLPEKTKKSILFRKVGGLKNAENPQALLKSLKDSEQIGYSHITGQDIKNKMLELDRKLKNKKRLKNISKVLGVGGALGAGATVEELIRHNK